MGRNGGRGEEEDQEEEDTVKMKENCYISFQTKFTHKTRPMDVW